MGQKSDGVDGENASEGPLRSSQLGRPGPDHCAPQPAGGAAQKSSASVRRALFARRRLDASSSPGGSPSPSTAPPTIQPPPSSPRSPSPGLLRASTPPSPLSLSTSRPVSPFPGLSPIVPEPPVPPGPPGAAASGGGPPGGAASGGGPCLHGAGAASMRLVSPFSFNCVESFLPGAADSRHCFHFSPAVTTPRV